MFLNVYSTNAAFAACFHGLRIVDVGLATAYFRGASVLRITCLLPPPRRVKHLEVELYVITPPALILYGRECVRLFYMLIRFPVSETQSLIRSGNAPLWVQHAGFLRGTQPSFNAYRP
jgi:hypothetical protein